MFHVAETGSVCELFGICEPLTLEQDLFHVAETGSACKFVGVCEPLTLERDLFHVAETGSACEDADWQDSADQSSGWS